MKEKIEEIFLCAPEPFDVEVMFAWENDPQYRHFGYNMFPVSRHSLEMLVICQMETTLQQEKQMRYMIKRGNRKSVKEAVDVGVWDIFDYNPVHRRASCGIFIAPEYQEKGYAKTALTEGLERAKIDLGLHQLYAEIREDNEKSLHLFQKSGFEYCGRQKDWFAEGEKYFDIVCFQKIL